MSLSTFNRRFSEETGRSPGAWLADHRLNADYRGPPT
jgi:transcriptional regulator GlxA family with amidase domain